MCKSGKNEMLCSKLFLVCVSALGLLFAWGCGRLDTPAATLTSTPSRIEGIPATFTKMTPDQDRLPPILHSPEWEAPIPIPGAINTAGAEDSSFVAPDGSTFYFFFTPDGNIPAEKQLLDGVTGIYVSKQQGGTWGEPERLILQDPGKLALDGCEFVQGDILWFCSAREGYSGVNLFTATFREGRWQDWRYAGDQINREYAVGEMHINADGTEMYFHSTRPGGKGQTDIWVSEKTGDHWGMPYNLEAVNTPETEGWPFLTQDGKQLWFTRFFQGSPAIFRSVRLDNRWGEPELIISQFAGEPSLDLAGNIYFVHHFYWDSKMIEADIYIAMRK